jgi:hypothetical protein
MAEKDKQHSLTVGGTERITESDTDQTLVDKLTEERVRIGTLLKTDNIAFLFAAGASIDAGGVGLGVVPGALEKALLGRWKNTEEQNLPWIDLFYATLSKLTGKEVTLSDREKLHSQGEFKRDQEIAWNVEGYMSHLHMWRAATVGDAEAIGLRFPNEGKLLAKKDVLEKLIEVINDELTKLLDLPKPGKEAALNVHRLFIKKILTRPLNLRRANIVTLNYDTLIEQAGDAEGAVLVDGFVGTMKRIFRPECYDLDFYFPAQTTEGRVHRFDRALHLYKLHGSLNWRREEASWQNPYGLSATYYDQKDSKADVLIYPTPLKYGQALGLPYSELFRRFSASISQPQSVLFCIGYGFGDDHVNALIHQALAIPSFTLVVVDPKPQSQFVADLRAAMDERVWIIEGWEIGTFSGFVDKLLPDLGYMEFNEKVIKTYNALAKKKPTSNELNAPGAEKKDA